MTPSPEYLLALMSVSAIAVLLAVWCFRMTRKSEKRRQRINELEDIAVTWERAHDHVNDSCAKLHLHIQGQNREIYELNLIHDNDRAQWLAVRKNEAEVFGETVGQKDSDNATLTREISLLKTFLKRRAPEVCTFIHKPEKYKAWLGKIAATRGKKEHPSGISDKDIKRIGKALDKFDAALKSNNPYEMYVNTEFPPTHVPPAGPHRGFSTHNDLQTKAEHTLAGVRAKNGKGLGALLPE